MKENERQSGISEDDRRSSVSGLTNPPATAADLHEWLIPFLVVQALERSHENKSKLFFHEAPGQTPTIIPGRVIIWPAEFKRFISRK